jgi:hypothetical protein
MSTHNGPKNFYWPPQQETEAERLISKLLNELLGGKFLPVMRMSDGTSYIEFDPGWTIEFLICAKANRSLIPSRWARVAKRTNHMRRENPTGDLPNVPALFYKLGRDKWRVIWPLHLAAAQQFGFASESYEHTVEGSPDAWASKMRLTLAQMANPTLRAYREALTNPFFSYGLDPNGEEEEDDPR